MDLTIHPGKLTGTTNIIPSKSLAHRYLICAAFSSTATTLLCSETNRDIDATVDCLNALGASIYRNSEGFLIEPIQVIPRTAVLNCCESGSTLRFLLPIVGALGVDATFCMEGRLSQRPLSPLWEELTRMGCKLSRPADNVICCTGKLQSGEYCMEGSVSSQFITGLCFALPLLEGESSLRISGKLESKPYVNMTAHAIVLFGYPGKPSPDTVMVDGDWSNAAFWLGANALDNDITVSNLDFQSPQGDRAVLSILPALDGPVTIDVSDMPDLVPILAVVAAAKQGAVFTNIQRLRLKESDRVASIAAMIENLGGKVHIQEDTLTVHGTGLVGGTVDSSHDHRIAMAAAIAATVCTDDVTIFGAEAVSKSYPTFWDVYKELGGKYEQYLR